MRILVVEDETAIAAFLQDGLVKAGYGVDLAPEGAEALHWVAIVSYDLIILDVMLPDMDGLSLCATLRRTGIAIPVLMLTARETIEDRVAGLDSGADDYLVKPFAFAELLARMRALLRREPAMLGVVLQLADLTLDQALDTGDRRAVPAGAVLAVGEDAHEQQQDPDLGKHGERDAARAAEVDQPRHRGSDDDAGSDLAQYGRHTDPLGELRGTLGGGEHHQQVEEDAGEIDTRLGREQHEQQPMQRTFL